MEVKDNRKGHGSRDIQLQHAGSLTLYAWVLQDNYTQDVSRFSSTNAYERL